MVSDGTTAYPLVGARVTIEFSDAETDVTFTAASGAYSYSTYDTHPPGEVTLEASFEGYQNGFAYASWQCETLISGLDIALAPVPSPTPTPAPTPTPEGYATPTPAT